MIEIKPLEGLDATVRVPGSKSYTQRAMVIAALAEGESRLTEVLLAEDTAILGRALEALGAQIRTEGTEMLVRGTGGRIARPAREIHLGNNGTAMRLLTGVASLGEGPIVLTGDPRLRERPLKPLLDALAALGVETRTEGGTRLSPGHDPGRPSDGRGGAPPGHRKQPVRLGAPDRRPLRGRGGRPSSSRGGSPPSPTSRSPWRRWGPSASTSPWTGPAATW